MTCNVRPTNAIVRLTAGVVLGVAIFVSAGFAVTVDDFGAGTAGVPSAGTTRMPPVGSRPLLPILFRCLDRTYGSLPFLPGFPGDGVGFKVDLDNVLFQGNASVSAWLLEISGGKFTFEPSDRNLFGPNYFLGPYVRPDDPATPALDESIDATGTGGCGTLDAPGRPIHYITAAVNAAVVDGYDFYRFDVDGDRQVYPWELTLMLVSPFPIEGGAVRDGACIDVTRPGDLLPFVVCPTKFISILEGTSATTIAHELIHVLGQFGEGYASSFNPSKVDGLSITGTPATGAIVHLDAFWKMRFGWTVPVIVNADTPACYTLAPAEEAGPQPGDPTPDARALILYDPSRGTHEYLLLEYRNATPTNFDGNRRGTGNAMSPSSGLAVWHVQTNANHELLTVLNRFGGKDTGLYVVQEPLPPPRRGVIRLSRGYFDYAAYNPPNPKGLWAPTGAARRVLWSDNTEAARIEVMGRYVDHIGIAVGGAICPPAFSAWLKPPAQWSSHSRTETPEGSLVDRWETPSFVLARSVPASVISRLRFKVRWSVTPKRPLPCPPASGDDGDIDIDGCPLLVQIRDILPVGFSGATGNLPIAVDVSRTETAEAAYEVQAPAIVGGFPIQSSITFDPYLGEPDGVVDTITQIVDPHLASPADAPCEGSCDDGNPCTIDRCLLGSCSGSLMACDDADPCTDDRCEAVADTAVCRHDNNFACVTAQCGNGVVDAGETCDPPDPTINPDSGQPSCRLDCTWCGDGVVQSANDEECDDGNDVSGCAADDPRQALDTCMSSCSLPICVHPARVLTTAPHATLKLGARLFVENGVTVDWSAADIVVEVEKVGRTIFRQVLPVQNLSDGSRGRYRNLSPIDGTVPGFGTFRAVAFPGYSKVKLIAYGNLADAGPDMTVRLAAGGRVWILHGVWDEKRSGWRLPPKTALLSPP